MTDFDVTGQGQPDPGPSTEQKDVPIASEEYLFTQIDKMREVVTQLERDLEWARSEAGRIVDSRRDGGRELSLAITKVEEAHMWMNRADEVIHNVLRP